MLTAKIAVVMHLLVVRLATEEPGCDNCWCVTHTSKEAMTQMFLAITMFPPTCRVPSFLFAPTAVGHRDGDLRSGRIADALPLTCRGGIHRELAPTGQIKTDPERCFGIAGDVPGGGRYSSPSRDHGIKSWRIKSTTWRTGKENNRVRENWELKRLDCTQNPQKSL